MFHAIIAWLSAIPLLPPASLIIVVFATIWAIRKFLPSTWLWVERKFPLVTVLDEGPVFTILWKAWQALPGMLLGSAVLSLESGASVGHALSGVLAGVLASVAHEVLAAYKGQVGGKGGGASAGATVLLIALGFHTSACALFGSGGALSPVLQCAPSPAHLLDEVATILLGGGDTTAELEQAALTEGESAIVCAVHQLVESWGKLRGTSADSHVAAARARGEAYLAKHSGAK